MLRFIFITITDDVGELSPPKTYKSREAHIS